MKGQEQDRGMKASKWDTQKSCEAIMRLYQW